MALIRVLLADDHALFRRGMAKLLANQGDFEVVGEAGDGRQALELARALVPDVILMDVSMPCMDGFEATRRITAEIPHAKVIILTAESEDGSFKAASSGASGYLPKSIGLEVLYATLRGVARGEAPCRG